MKFSSFRKGNRMFLYNAGIAVFLFMTALCNIDGKDSQVVFPLKVSSDHRCLVDQNNYPFFWSGEAAWSLIAQLGKNDVDFYLDNRREKGFSVIMVSLIEHKFCTKPPANYYGDKPFTGKIFTTPDEKYFAHADYVIQAAAQRNIVVLLAPLYLGYGCKDEGWCSEVKSASLNDMYAWGAYVGERYKKYSNIIWLIGGDTDPSQVKDKVLEMVKGLRDHDQINLFSAHNQPGSMATSPWPNEQWLSVNNVYSYDSLVYRHYKTAYLQTPAMAYFQIESTYENEHHSTPQQLRSQAYWALLTGAMGHTFGNCPIWHFGSTKPWCGLADWKTEMNNDGSKSMDYLRRLFMSRQWNLLVPDLEHHVITSGYGTWGLKDYVTAAATSDRNTIIAYLPSGRKVTVDLSNISGSNAKAWWYDPRTGRAENIGSYPAKGSQVFTAPDKNDWVLVIDNDSRSFPEPGKLLKSISG